MQLKPKQKFHQLMRYSAINAWITTTYHDYRMPSYTSSRLVTPTKTLPSCHLSFCKHIFLCSQACISDSDVTDILWQLHQYSCETVIIFLPFHCSTVEAQGQFSHATTVQHMKDGSQCTFLAQAADKRDRTLHREHFWYFIYASAQCFKERKPSQK